MVLFRLGKSVAGGSDIQGIEQGKRRKKVRVMYVYESSITVIIYYVVETMYVCYAPGI